jgi:hypothetical protein
MIIYNDKFKSESDVNDAVSEYRQKLADFAKKGGYEPQANDLIKKIANGDSFEFIDKTQTQEEQEKQDVLNQKILDDLESEKLAAQTTPSVKYAEFRVAEYPKIEDYLDAQVKKSSPDLIIKQAGETQEAKYLADCLVVKEKYSAP